MQTPLLKGYNLIVDDVERKVKGLTKEEIWEIRDYEKWHKNRKTLIEPLDRKV